jgi:hypothetical protein
MKDADREYARETTRKKVREKVRATRRLQRKWNLGFYKNVRLSGAGATYA